MLVNLITLVCARLYCKNFWPLQTTFEKGIETPPPPLEKIVSMPMNKLLLMTLRNCVQPL